MWLSRQVEQPSLIQAIWESTGDPPPLAATPQQRAPAPRRWQVFAVHIFGLCKVIRIWFGDRRPHRETPAMSPVQGSTDSANGAAAAQHEKKDRLYDDAFPQSPRPQNPAPPGRSYLGAMPWWQCVCRLFAAFGDRDTTPKL